MLRLHNQFSAIIGSFPGTQEDLAGLTGVSQQAISQIKVQRRSPTLRTMWRILDALGYELQIQAKSHD